MSTPLKPADVRALRECHLAGTAGVSEFCLAVIAIERMVGRGLLAWKAPVKTSVKRYSGTVLITAEGRKVLAAHEAAIDARRRQVMQEQARARRNKVAA